MIKETLSAGSIRLNCRKAPDGPLALYDLSTDPAEKTDVAAAHQEIVRRMEQLLVDEHTDSPLWQFGPKKKQ